MKKTIILALMMISILSLVLTGCEEEQEEKNNQIANPASEFCVENGGTLEIVTAEDGSQNGICTLADGTECDEWAYYRGECPEKEEEEPELEKVYCTEEQKAAEICTMEYMPVCGDDGKTYGNKCSACASKNIDYYTPGECVEKEEELMKNYCSEPRPEMCTKEYVPVCGWFDESVQCVKYPCAATYGNKCTACTDEKVAYWTDGECPE